jgi:hypothetical protein
MNALVFNKLTMPCGIIGVESPEGRRQRPPEWQQTIAKGRRQVRMWWHGYVRGSPSPVSFTENGTDPNGIKLSPKQSRNREVIEL